MISAERAATIERELASLVGVEPDQLRDYLRGYIKAGRAPGVPVSASSAGRIPIALNE